MLRIDLGNGSGADCVKKFHDLLQPHLPSLCHIPLNVVQIIDHLGCIIPVPILFCSTWKVPFGYMLLCQAANLGRYVRNLTT